MQSQNTIFPRIPHTLLRTRQPHAPAGGLGALSATGTSASSLWQLFLPQLLAVARLSLCPQLHPLSLTWGTLSQDLPTECPPQKPPQGIPPISMVLISTQGTDTIKKSKETIDTKFTVLEHRGMCPGRDKDRTLILVILHWCLLYLLYKYIVHMIVSK